MSIVWCTLIQNANGNEVNVTIAFSSFYLRCFVRNVLFYFASIVAEYYIKCVCFLIISVCVCVCFVFSFVINRKNGFIVFFLVYIKRNTQIFVLFCIFCCCFAFLLKTKREELFCIIAQQTVKEPCS